MRISNAHQRAIEKDSFGCNIRILSLSIKHNCKANGSLCLSVEPASIMIKPAEIIRHR